MLLTLDQKVPGLNSARGGVKLLTGQLLIAQSLLLSPLMCLSMT